MRQLSGIVILGLTSFLGILGGQVCGGAFENYQERPSLSFSLPGSSLTGASVMDALPDGRLVVITTRAAAFSSGPAELYVENGVGSREFRYLGDLPLSSADDDWWNPGAFLRTSPSTAGGKVAVGNSSASVGVFSVSDLVIPAVSPAIGTPAPVNVNWYLPDISSYLSSGAWYDNRYLAIGSAPFGGPAKLEILDTQTGDIRSIVAGPTAGASSGIGFDAAGNLFYGNGYDYNFNGETGEIRRIDAGNWQDVLFGASSALAFSAGDNLGEVLSANWLNIDAEGNLLIGGGDSFGSDLSKKNFLAIAKLLPDGSIDSTRTFDPDALSAINSYSVILNRATGEILAFDPFGGNPSQVFVISVPEPASMALLALGAIGALRWGRRRGMYGVR